MELARLPQWLRARAATLELDLDDAARAIHRRAHRRKPAGRAAGARETQARGGAAADSVDLAAVQASIGDSARFDVFQLGEAALAADVPRALRILAGLRSEGVEPTLALWSLAREIRNAWGTTQNEGSTRAAGSGPRPALETAKRRAARLPYARLAARISRADRMIKGQHRGDAWDEMALLIVEFAGRRTLPLTGNRAA